MNDFCAAVEQINSNGIVVIMKKKPKGCTPSGPTSDCNPASGILEGDGAFNGFMWFDADRDFGFDMKDRLSSDGMMMGENGGNPMYFGELSRMIASGAIEMKELDSRDEWSVAVANGSGELPKFTMQLIKQNSWVDQILQNGGNVIFLQQER